MYIETDRLIIRDMELLDEAAYVEMASDGSLDEDIFAGCSNKYHEWMRGWIAETIVLNQKDNPLQDYLAYSIVEKESQAVVGSIGCSYFDALDRVGLVYFIGAKYRKKGYAAEATVAYSHYFLEHYNIPKLIANIRTANHASCKTVEKAGYILVETKMYKDVIDTAEKLYSFYEMQKCNCVSTADTVY